MKEESYNIHIPATKEGRAAQMRAIISDAIRIKRESTSYFLAHGTFAGFTTDSTK